ncbi:primosomal protein N' [Pseudomaricurvus alcaniphilus]|uniref:primosomal protein N' n=1 Tax=Pseudomaricurvus alcaniphilus TaxID=1166482 RepID=UPI001407E2EF|nr:primosomal protein N' [Pseudomaricurvus alcaniphilus]NHN38562.1 primosomal protein N' [Pseudomaricurvus alcaniphilus]
MPEPAILAVALPTPLRKTFDYLAATEPAATSGADTWVGCRVAVRFGQQRLVGIVVAVKQNSPVDPARLRPIEQRLDLTPLLPNELLELCQWTANYYHHPLGEVLATALPAGLKLGEAAERTPVKAWQLTTAGCQAAPQSLARSPRQRALLEELQQRHQAGQELVLHSDLLQIGFQNSNLKSLQDKQLLTRQQANYSPDRSQPLLRQEPLALNPDQASALEQIDFSGFATYLLHGTTGSGKTEVYLQAIATVLAAGQQALLLIPEIGLTPQMLKRFQLRFNRPLTIIHSGLSDGERKQAWLDASNGDTDIIIGTRSAVFTPLPRPGIIIIDEEHDLSFKQQDGLRYSARDLAVIRAQKLQIPLLLGSATPSLESLCNAYNQRFQLLQLPHRAGAANPPAIELIDLKRQALLEGISQTALDSIDQRLEAAEQVLVFINRRGFAPTLMCHDCGWIAQCAHCDARLTVHQQPNHLHCHHCDHQRSPIKRCPNCHSLQLNCLGQGTERAETVLRERFPQYPVLRVDRDSTSRKHAMQSILDQVNRGEPCILVGTQMLAKGHHFANVTLAVILDADSGMFSTDFRGPERMGQLLIQVAGRSGRASKPGKVLIQTHLGDHPLLQTLLRQGYSEFAKLQLRERQLTQLPPYRYLALLRAESKRPENAIELLNLARQLALACHPAVPQMSYLGPLPAPMERRNQRFRYQLQINAGSRAQLHHLLQQLLPQLEQSALSRRARWSVDIDPQDMS